MVLSSQFSSCKLQDTGIQAQMILIRARSLMRHDDVLKQFKLYRKIVNSLKCLTSKSCRITIVDIFIIRELRKLSTGSVSQINFNRFDLLSRRTSNLSRDTRRLIFFIAEYLQCNRTTLFS